MGKTTKTAARDVTSPAVVSLVEDLASQALAAGVRTTAPGTLKREALSAGGSTQAVDSSHGQLPTLRSLDVTGQDLAHASVLLDLQLDGQRYCCCNTRCLDPPSQHRLRRLKQRASTSRPVCRLLMHLPAIRSAVSPPAMEHRSVHANKRLRAWS